jgi:RNA polymerase sigma-70 factor (ECF subfamily)
LELTASKPCPLILGTVPGGFSGSARRRLGAPGARRTSRVRAMDAAPDGGDDAALMRAYAAGDLRAFERLYARHRGPLYRYLVRQSGDRTLADDLFQETWSRVIGARARYEPRAKFQTWLFTLAYNCFIDHCRRTRARPAGASTTPDGADLADTLPASPHDGPEQHASDAQLRERLRVALDALPAEQRDAFLLYEQAGLGVEEIAQATGVGMETAKSRLRYAVAKLRAALADVAPERVA